MPPLGGALNDEQIASVLTYVRREWGNTGSPVSVEDVREVRGLTKTRTRPWTDAELTPAGTRAGRAGAVTARATVLRATCYVRRARARATCHVHGSCTLGIGDGTCMARSEVMRKAVDVHRTPCTGRGRSGGCVRVRRGRRRPRRRRARRAGGAGGGGRGGGAAAAGFFTAVDANKDGATTRDEMRSTFERWFGEWDTAKAGTLGQEQIATGLAAAMPAPACRRAAAGAPVARIRRRSRSTSRR